MIPPLYRSRPLMTETRKSRKWHLFVGDNGLSLCQQWARPGSDQLVPLKPGDFAGERPQKFECPTCHRWFHAEFAVPTDAFAGIRSDEESAAERGAA